MCAAKLAGLKHGSNRHKKVEVPNGTPSEADTLAADEAGKAFGIGRRQVFRALRILREGCKELVKQCEDGKVAVSLVSSLLVRTLLGYATTSHTARPMIRSAGIRGSSRETSHTSESRRQKSCSNSNL